MKDYPYDLPIPRAEPNWGRELFAARFAAPLGTLLRAVADYCGEAIKLLLNGEVVLVAEPPGARATAASGAGDQQIVFEIAGLGTVAISRLSRTSSREESETGDGNGSLGAAGASAAPTASAVMLGALGEVIRSWMEVGISDHLTARQALHDVAISLAAVNGATEYVLDRTRLGTWPDNQKIRDAVLLNVDTIGNQVMLVTALSNHLLWHYSVVKDGTVADAARHNVDLFAEIQRVADTWEQEAAKRQIEIRCELHGTAIVHGNTFQLRQMLHNLVSNAVKYSYATSGRGGRRFVAITSHSHDPGFRVPRVSIAISNYGVGILPEELPRIGEPGFRGELARREQPVGFGVGVYMAKQIAQAHGGEIRFRSGLLHDSTRQTRTGPIVTKTSRVECVVLLPLVGKTDQLSGGQR